MGIQVKSNDTKQTIYDRINGNIAPAAKAPRRKKVTPLAEEDQLIDLLQLYEGLYNQHLQFKDYEKAQDVERKISLVRNKLDALTRGLSQPVEQPKPAKEPGLYRQDMAGALTSLSKDSPLREMGGAAVPTGSDWMGNQLMVPPPIKREGPQSQPTSLVPESRESSVPRKRTLVLPRDFDEEDRIKKLEEEKKKKEAAEAALMKAQEEAAIKQKALENSQAILAGAQKEISKIPVQQRPAIIERTKSKIVKRQASVEKAQIKVEEAQTKLNESIESIEQLEVQAAIQQSVIEPIGSVPERVFTLTTGITTSPVSARVVPLAQSQQQDTRIAKLQSDLNQARKQRDEYKSKYDSMGLELSELKVKQAIEKTKIFGAETELQQQISKLEKDVKSLEEQIKYEQDVIVTIQKKLTQEEKKSVEYQRKFLEEEQNSKNLLKTIESKQKELDKANKQIRDKNTEIVEMEQKLRQADPENTSVFRAMKKGFDDAVRNYNTEQTKYAKLLGEKQALLGTIAQLKRDKETEEKELKSRIAKLEVDLQNEKEQLRSRLVTQSNIETQTMVMLTEQLQANQQNEAELEQAALLIGAAETMLNPSSRASRLDQAKDYLRNIYARLQVSDTDLSKSSVNISGAINESREQIARLDESRAEFSSRYESFVNLSSQPQDPMLDVSDILDSATDVRDSAEELTAVTEQINMLEQQRDAALEENERLYIVNQNLMIKVDTQSEKYDRLVRTANTINEANINLQEDLSKLNKTIEEQQEKQLRSIFEKALANEKIEKLRAKLQELRQTTPAMQNTGEIDRVTGQLRTAEVEIQTFENQSLEDEGAINLLMEQQENLKTRIRQNLENEERLIKRIAELETEAVNTEAARQEERRAFGRVAQTSSDELNRARDLVADLRRQLAEALAEVARLEGRQPNVRVEREIVYQDRIIDRPVDRIVYRDPPGAQPADNFPAIDMQRNIFTSSAQFAPLPRRSDRRRPTGAAPVAASPGLIELLESLNNYINRFLEPRAPAGGLAGNINTIPGVLAGRTWTEIQNALQTQGMRSLNDITSQPDTLNQLMNSTTNEIAITLIRRMKGDGALPLRWRPAEDQEEETILLKNVIQLPEQVKRKKSQDKFTYGTIVPAKGTYQIKRQGLKYIAVGEGKKATFNTERDAQYFISAGGWGRKVYGPRIAQVFGVRPKNLSQTVY
jgi:hypothetical protein